MSQNYDYDNFMNEKLTLSGYTAKTFGWMFFGLMTTFILAFACYSTGFVWNILYIPYMHYILPGAELILVIVLSANLQKMSVRAAQTLFFVYAILNGLTFSVYFLIFEVTSMIYVFAATACLFGAMALFGHITKRDLSNWGSVLFFGLIALVAFWLFSMVINLSAFSTAISLIGIGIFIGFTAYDTQKIKSYYNYYYTQPEMLEKASIFSALQLYLDFINIFIYLLRFLGKRK